MFLLGRGNLANAATYVGLARSSAFRISRQRVSGNAMVRVKFYHYKHLRVIMPWVPALGP